MFSGSDLITQFYNVQNLKDIVHLLNKIDLLIQIGEPEPVEYFLTELKPRFLEQEECLFLIALLANLRSLCMAAYLESSYESLAKTLLEYMDQKDYWEDAEEAKVTKEMLLGNGM